MTSKGRQGSWFAEWQGELIPCIHKRWTEGHWPHFIDPGYVGRAEWGRLLRHWTSAERRYLRLATFLRMERLGGEPVKVNSASCSGWSSMTFVPLMAWP